MAHNDTQEIEEQLAARFVGGGFETFNSQDLEVEWCLAISIKVGC